MGPEVDGPVPLQGSPGRRPAECLVSGEGWADEHAQVRTEVSEDGDARALDPERGDVHSEHLGVGHHLPWRGAVEMCGGGEELRHHLGRDAPSLEIAVAFVGVGHPLDQALYNGVELRGRRDDDRDGVRDRGPHLGRKRMIGHADHVGPVFRTGQGPVQRGEQHPGDGALGILGSDRILADDEAGRRRQPDHQLRPVGLLAIVEEDRGRQPPPDPLVTTFWPGAALASPALFSP